MIDCPSESKTLLFTPEPTRLLPNEKMGFGDTWIPGGYFSWMFLKDICQLLTAMPQIQIPTYSCPKLKSLSFLPFLSWLYEVANLYKYFIQRFDWVVGIFPFWSYYKLKKSSFWILYSWDFSCLPRWVDIFQLG